MSSKAGKGKMPETSFHLRSSHVLPLIPRITKSRPVGFAPQFNTASDSGSATGSERSSSESIKL